MLRRIYVHNFRCLQNFEIKPGDNDSLLLIGKNGTGKSTMARILYILQQLGQGTSRLSTLAAKDDFTLGHTNERMALEVEVSLEGRNLSYSLILDLPENFRELRVVEENFLADGEPVFTRREARLVYHGGGGQTEFSLDWHSAALSLINEKGEGPLHLLRGWLRRLLILAPVPSRMGGESHGEPAHLVPSCENFADYLTTLLSDYPAAYDIMLGFLMELMPDLAEFTNKLIAANARLIRVKFSDDAAAFQPKFDLLSDGEKCMFLCSAVLAAQATQDTLFAFWGEPDNHLALSEIQPFIRMLRKKFRGGSQIWITSHNESAINCFSHENTVLLRRKTHLDPVEPRPLNELIEDTDSVARLLALDCLN